ncbi:hypothetical protein K431DRAFT_241801 [Polychaeton citri CBS 116435]|uniref:PRISE-like Rossmann-fold domain-containing protein n=1 Tax=Polychaeton citri CBS 116435 TaxID=1314669 RepID=A0A9P4QFU8_9PEZI|nr:hypothetical protein K431DRAFT_241801 [Polychaeton citri CBS 116435]
MGSEQLPLQIKGIFHNLPSFNQSITGLTAIVTGANGISGFHTMRVLLESPDRWSKVYAVSRRPPPADMMALLSEDQRTRVEHVASDFLSKPDEIARQLQSKDISKVDYVFFYSYAQPRPEEGKPAWSNAQELVDVNSTLLSNFLEALQVANLKPKRFLLQTGAKNYGVHLGPARTPFTESDPRVTIEPNFYYPQEDSLYEFSQKVGTPWNIICPAWVIGAVNNAAMNALHPLAVYAAVQAQKGELMNFPGDLDAWQLTREHSTAMLTGYLSEWAVLEDKCANQKFNASDSCPLPNNRLWPEIARWYGCEGSQKRPELDSRNLNTMTVGPSTPPLGYGPPAKGTFAWAMTQWAGEKANQEAWKEIMKQHGLSHNPFEDVEAHFRFADAVAWGFGAQLSMNKAKYFGFSGHVDTLESLFMAYKELNQLGMLPPPVVDEVQPLI